MEEDAEGIRLHHAVIGCAGGELKLLQARKQRSDNSRYGQPAERLSACGPRHQRLDQHDDNADERENDFGQDAEETLCLVHRFSATLLPVVLIFTATGDVRYGEVRSTLFTSPMTESLMARIQ